MRTGFHDCEICGAAQWTEAYQGAIRDGVFGAYIQRAVVARCGGCGVERLGEDFCAPPAFYETEAYRSKLQQGLGSDAYFSAHDDLQIQTLRAIWPQNLRGANVADVGCGGGALLDHLRGWTKMQVAVEPYDVFRTDLAARNYAVYPYAQDAVADWAGKIDMAFSVQVIEHTQNPRVFLEEIKPLLRSDGRLVISTPNVRDILFGLLPEDFPSFFYRVVHRWYFSADSLATCARLAGFKVESVRHIHRYKMANTLRWLRDRKPTGNAPMADFGQLADAFWTGYLESIGRSDCLYLILQPSG
jgi:2-polyprenyl-3-methyl-5-hydroxy-6-metoxy-1,4-benzoquinol methylase